ncbi:MAG: hypothetical protein JJU46_00995 [Balneolaceae bacterium]|nr:hypothetical protein [Balneolaceae bacterium]MCH8547414.1 hypothetical protein [Balneolaceae bacterium]
MKEKIEPFLPWMIVALIAAILIFIPKHTSGMYALAYAIYAPAMPLLQYTTVHAITVFGGGTFTLEPFMQTGLTAIIGLIVVLALTPFLLVKGYRAIREETLLKRSLVWYLGAILLVSSLGFALFNSALMATSYFAENRQIEENVLRDQLRSQLMIHGFAAAEKMLMPHDYGGGNGSFIDIPGEATSREIRLTDLKTWDENSEFSFRIEDSITDSTLTIIGSIAGSSDESSNSSSHYAIRVTPHESNTIRLLSEAAMSRVE